MTLTPTELGLLALVVTILGAWTVNVARASALSSTVLSDIKHLRESFEKLEKRLMAVDEIVVLRQRLEALERVVHNEHRPRLNDHGTRIQRIDVTIATITGPHAAMRPPAPSQPPTD